MSIPTHLYLRKLNQNLNLNAKIAFNERRGLVSYLLFISKCSTAPNLLESADVSRYRTLPLSVNKIRNSKRCQEHLNIRKIKGSSCRRRGQDFGVCT